MFKQRSEQEYETGSNGGVRHLFSIGPYEFHDTMNEEGSLHHFILDPGEDDGPGIYEVDQPTMYEFMARFLAGHYEIEKYHLEHSPGHDALLDVLEMASARARAGESGFSWDEFDHGDTELLNNDEPDAGGERPRDS